MAAEIAVMIGAVAAAERTRCYDAVVLELLGATAPQVLSAQAIECLLLSIILSGIALLVGGGAGWCVVVPIFGLAWVPDLTVVRLTLGAAVVSTFGTGLAGSLSALRVRPLNIIFTASLRR
jgi:putative ABC transport system permease protein